MAELEVELILARSPQAKGRVERKHRVLQDRLVKELRLRRISDIAQANALLESRFLKQINTRYAQPARRSADLHRRLHPKYLQQDLPRVLCVSEPRVVGRDWCVRYQNQVMQIDAAHKKLALAGKSVTVKQPPGGRLLLIHRGVELTWTAARTPRGDTPRGDTLRGGKPRRPPAVNNKRWKPPPSHPWQRPAVLQTGAQR